MGFFDWLSGKKKPTPPEEQVEREIQQKSEKVHGFEAKIAELLAREASLETDLNLAQHEVDKWTLIADEAVKIGKPLVSERDLREAVRNKLEATNKFEQLKDNQNMLRKAIEGLKEQLKFANDKIDMSKAKNATLQARLEAARVREDLSGNEGPIEALNNLEEETLKAEGRAEAKEEISQFQQDFIKTNVVQNVDVDAEVERLMGNKK